MSYRTPLFFASIALAASACEPSMLPEAPGEERFLEGEVIVRFKDGADATRRDAAFEAIGSSTVTRIPLVGADAIELDGRLDVGGALEALHPFADVVEYAEPNFLYQPSGTPSDYDASLLWGLEKIQSPGAWATTEGSAEVIVAVIDSGVDIYHPDLSANIWRNTGETQNGIDDDGNGRIDDLYGWDFARGDSNPDDEVAHGTHVAGTIGALGGNGGLVGVSPRVKIMPLKTLVPQGGSTVAAIHAIDYARQNGAHVINASWGGGGYSNALREAIARAGQAGILFVAASGNGDAWGRGIDNDASPIFPASFNLPNIVSVAATDPSDRLASFSNYGATSVDLAAPGTSIASTMPGEQFAYLDGTSMASPHVAGVAALLKAVRPELGASSLKDLLLQTVDPVGTLSGRVVSGGRLNARRAVDAAAGMGAPDPEPAPESFTWVNASGGSAHPYANDFDQTWSVTQPGASEVRVRFSKVQTEAGYDFLILYDKNDNEVARYDGALGGFETVSVPGDTVYIRLVTDYSVTDYGFEVNGFGWR